jgi:hypothetical protein
MLSNSVRVLSLTLSPMNSIDPTTGASAAAP